MKIKTSITLSEDLLKIIDQRLKQHKNRSEFIENALRTFIAQTIREEENARDINIINENIEQLSQEAEDVLSYQVPL